MARLQFTARILLIIIFLCGIWVVRSVSVSAADTLPEDEGNSNSIAGLVWMDLNNNGQHEGEEPLVADQMVFVTTTAESDFAQLLILTTNAKGEFSAVNLASGRYRVWAAGQNEEAATTVTITGDRSVMTVQLPLVGFTLYMPQIAR